MTDQGGPHNLLRDRRSRQAYQHLLQAARQAIGVRFVAMLVLVAVSGYVLEAVKGQFPFLESLELKKYEWASRLDPRRPWVGHVALVEVDDDTYWSSPIPRDAQLPLPSAELPTNREFLARIIKIAADAGAAVIALDFEMTSPNPASIGDNLRRKTQNAALLSAIQYATSDKHVPIVFTSVLVSREEGWVRLPNIFDDVDLPCFKQDSTHPSGNHDCQSYVGYINLPLDKRQIPLETTALDAGWNPQLAAPKTFDSFALAVSNAYDSVTHTTPPVRERRPIAAALEGGEFVYGGFIRSGAFPRVSALALLEHNPGAVEKLRYRVVMIGSTWHQYAKNSGPPVESFESPVGILPGLYLHANYVEALLDGRLKRPTAPWFALIFDLLLGFLTYVTFHLSHRGRSRFCLASLIALPLCAAYVLSLSFGIYLDFILPLGAVFVHMFFEHYFSLKKQAYLVKKATGYDG